MKTISFLVLCLAIALLTRTPLAAQTFESATQAVANMRVGWNLGNSLDSNSGDTLNLWIEQWTDGTPTAYETAWGNPVTTPQLITMFKDAGFNAIRVPVTWYPHIYPDGAIDEAWMTRVHEVVDYVIDQGLYCILNVHHDTGASNTAWLRADNDTYEQACERYKNLWTNIANEFIDYDEKLVFEAYNEMLDKYNSWCFASFYSPNSYDSAAATEAYNAINSYAQDFVDVVRATGGNNAERNLVICTYGACSGDGTWSSHLTEPLTELNYPNDTAEDHIIFEVHYYPELLSTVAETLAGTEVMLQALKSGLMSKGNGAPVIIGECGTLDESVYDTNHDRFLDFTKQYVSLARDYGVTCFYWMMLSDGNDRAVPQWTRQDLAEAILQGYYGDDYTLGISSINASRTPTSNAIYNLSGQQITQPTKGIYIRNGKKYIAR